MTEPTDIPTPSMEAVTAFFEKGDRLAKYLGIELEEVRVGYARASMQVQPFHMNAVDVVHGAAIFALADYAFAAACNACGTIAVAINVSITFINAAKAGTLFTEARETSVNPKLGTYEIEVKDDEGRLIASFHGLAYRKKHPLPLT